MRLIIDVLPLLPENSHGPLRLTLGATFKPRRFALPVAPEVTFEKVWASIEERYKKNYLTQAQAASFVIKKLQDGYNCDLDLSDSVNDIFGDVTDQEQRVVKVVPGFVDRAMSVPFTSNLRPATAQKRIRELNELHANKRRRIEYPYGGTLGFNRGVDRPIPSTEADENSDGEREPNGEDARRFNSPDAVVFVRNSQTGHPVFEPLRKVESPEPGNNLLRTIPESDGESSQSPMRKERTDHVEASSQQSISRPALPASKMRPSVNGREKSVSQSVAVAHEDTHTETEEVDGEEGPNSTVQVELENDIMQGPESDQAISDEENLDHTLDAPRVETAANATQENQSQDDVSSRLSVYDTIPSPRPNSPAQKPTKHLTTYGKPSRTRRRTPQRPEATRSHSPSAQASASNSARSDRSLSRGPRAYQPTEPEKVISTPDVNGETGPQRAKSPMSGTKMLSLMKSRLSGAGASDVTSALEAHAAATHQSPVTPGREEQSAGARTSTLKRPSKRSYDMSISSKTPKGDSAKGVTRLTAQGSTKSGNTNTGQITSRRIDSLKDRINRNKSIEQNQPHAQRSDRSAHMNLADRPTEEAENEEDWEPEVLLDDFGIELSQPSPSVRQSNEHPRKISPKVVVATQSKTKSISVPQDQPEPGVPQSSPIATRIPPTGNVRLSATPLRASAAPTNTAKTPNAFKVNTSCDRCLGRKLKCANGKTRRRCDRCIKDMAACTYSERRPRTKRGGAFGDGSSVVGSSQLAPSSSQNKENREKDDTTVSPETIRALTLARDALRNSQQVVEHEEVFTAPSSIERADGQKHAGAHGNIDALATEHERPEEHDVAVVPSDADLPDADVIPSREDEAPPPEEPPDVVMHSPLLQPRSSSPLGAGVQSDGYTSGYTSEVQQARVDQQLSVEIEEASQKSSWSPEKSPEKRIEEIRSQRPQDNPSWSFANLEAQKLDEEEPAQVRAKSRSSSPSDSSSSSASSSDSDVESESGSDAKSRQSFLVTGDAASSKASPAASRRPARFLSHSPTPEKSSSEEGSRSASPEAQEADVQAATENQVDSDNESSTSSTSDTSTDTDGSSSGSEEAGTEEAGDEHADVDVGVGAPPTPSIELAQPSPSVSTLARDPGSQLLPETSQIPLPKGTANSSLSTMQESSEEFRRTPIPRMTPVPLPENVRHLQKKGNTTENNNNKPVAALSQPQDPGRKQDQSTALHSSQSQAPARRPAYQKYPSIGQQLEQARSTPVPKGTPTGFDPRKHDFSKLTKAKSGINGKNRVFNLSESSSSEESSSESSDDDIPAKPPIKASGKKLGLFGR